MYVCKQNYNVCKQQEPISSAGQHSKYLFEKNINLILYFFKLLIAVK